MAAGGNWGHVPSKSMEMIEKIGVLQRYCEFVGYTVDQIFINSDDVLDDANLGLLKIASVGDIVDGVGLRASEDEFYVVRKPVF
jgi:hypothetical protein